MDQALQESQDVFFALGGRLEHYKLGDSRPLDELYGPRFLGSNVVHVEGESEYDDNNYYTPSMTLLVAPDVTSLKAAMMAAATEFLKTPEGREHYFEYENAYFYSLMDGIPDLILWRHGIVRAYFDWSKNQTIDWYEEILEEDQLHALGLDLG